jgi:hypothetical protein
MEVLFSIIPPWLKGMHVCNQWRCSCRKSIDGGDPVDNIAILNKTPDILRLTVIVSSSAPDTNFLLSGENDT